MAVIQDNIKRLLAYSSIAHAGYLLIGFVPGTSEGYAAVVFYLICYLFMNLGAFGVVVVLAHRGKDCERMESLAGLATARPGLAALMTLFMVSLAGIPGTAGFIGKFVIFSAAVSAGFVPLAILRLELSTGEGLVLLVCAFGVLYFGIFPNNGSIPFVGDINLLDWTRDSVQFLLARGRGAT
jgi:NADH:ubiquinone oxidoreductase subunit 2 (subunit N)